MNATANPQVIRINARSSKALVARPSVVVLANIASEPDFLRGAFPDPIDQAALRDAVHLMHDVALSHDNAGSYGVYAIEPIELQEVRPC